jgi:hypothetical protein
MNTHPHARQRQELELLIYGLKQAILNKWQDITGLELQLRQAQDQLKKEK